MKISMFHFSDRGFFNNIIDSQRDLQMYDYEERAVISIFASQGTFLHVGKNEKQREIVVVCFPFSARYHTFQRSVRIDTNFTLLVY